MSGSEGELEVILPEHTGPWMVELAYGDSPAATRDRIQSYRLSAACPDGPAVGPWRAVATRCTEVDVPKILM